MLIKSNTHRPIFLFSDWGSIGFLGLRLKRAGVPILLYVHKEQARDLFKGLLPKTTDPMPPKDALVLFDGIGHGDLGQTLRKRGQLVIGGNPFDKPLERDRWAGIQVMQKAGITTPETKNFSNIGGAEKFLESSDGTWYVKMSGSGSTSEADTCNGDVATLLRYLHYLKGTPGDKTLILQRQVKGVEVSTDGWFDGTKFVLPFDGTFENKKFMPGELGPRTGCESCVVWMYPPQARLPKETLGLIEGRLAQERYQGPIDLNAIVAADGSPSGLEWTARLGFDATQAWVRFFEPRSLADQLWEFAAGGLHTWELSAKPGDLAVTLRVSVPPYPTSPTKESREMANHPMDRAWLSGGAYDPEDIMAGEGGPVLAGASGLVGVIGAIGPKLSPIVDEVRDIADALKLPGKQYRVDDPLARAEKDWATLRKQGKL